VRLTAFFNEAASELVLTLFLRHKGHSLKSLRLHINQDGINKSSIFSNKYRSSSLGECFSLCLASLSEVGKVEEEQGEGRL